MDTGSNFNRKHRFIIKNCRILLFYKVYSSGLGMECHIDFMASTVFLGVPKITQNLNPVTFFGIIRFQQLFKNRLFGIGLGLFRQFAIQQNYFLLQLKEIRYNVVSIQECLHRYK